MRDLTGDLPNSSRWKKNGRLGGTVGVGKVVRTELFITQFLSVEGSCSNQPVFLNDHITKEDQRITFSKGNRAGGSAALHRDWIYTPSGMVFGDFILA
ncbi:hypothetical protein TNIN_241881 [Trichonephila inaurata madagascariensis]|uniref:Uncharacterized protein n=1 Tax=Trichonephila inaurata madagascariensis TaxID=2747483 RepID=A0A8X6XT61_9ARAC|nr:hypothetical protein TNIN_241881 [Trichonephila inaurata madagascariensis]